MVDELKTMFETSRLEVIEVTGKLVFTRFMQREKLNELLSNNKFYRKILELEITFNNDPSTYSGITPIN